MLMKINISQVKHKNVNALLMETEKRKSFTNRKGMSFGNQFMVQSLIPEMSADLMKFFHQ